MREGGRVGERGIPVYVYVKRKVVGGCVAVVASRRSDGN